MSSRETSGGKPIVHSQLLPDDRLRVVVELRQPRRRVFEATVPYDADAGELAALVADLQRIVLLRRGKGAQP
jgi:hypothetical protein